VPVKKSPNQLPLSERAAKSVNQKLNLAWFGRWFWFGVGMTSVAPRFGNGGSASSRLFCQ
jgi:hypothetical protein